METEFFNRFLRAPKDAKYALVSTGVGVSAESGLPTFRSENGLRKKLRARSHIYLSHIVVALKPERI
jgi:NAD-dependent SIR2 family protein deacetylase